MSNRPWYFTQPPPDPKATRDEIVREIMEGIEVELTGDHAPWGKYGPAITFTRGNERHQFRMRPTSDLTEKDEIRRGRWENQSWYRFVPFRLRARGRTTYAIDWVPPRWYGSGTEPRDVPKQLVGNGTVREVVHIVSTPQQKAQKNKRPK